MPKGSSPVGRGITWGLLGALVLGGAALAVWGLYLTVGAPDCAGMSPSECALEREIALAFGRRQTLFGAAMAVLGVALAIYLRSRDAAGLEDEETHA